MIIGFTQKNSEEKNVYSVHNIGKLGCYGVGSTNAYGILKEINYNEGYLLIQPSIVSHGDLLRIEKNRPTIIGIVPGQSIIMRPLRDGDLEQIVIEHNSKNNKNSK